MPHILTANGKTLLVEAASARPGNDPIFALNAEAKKRQSAGESILNATLGALMEDDGRMAVMPTVFEAFRGAPMELAAAYAPISGDAGFLRAVVRDLFGEGKLADEAVAVATPGATGALHHATVNFLEPGQSMLVPDYFWGPYQTIAVHTRRAVETFEMFGDEGAFNLRAFEEGLARLIARQGRALVVFNFPCNNPTGYSLTAEEWESVADIVERHAQKAPVAFLIDFAYADFGGDDARSWVKHVERMARQAVVLVAWTISKSMAQYGARVGALVAVQERAGERTAIANALGFSCRGTWSNCNHLGMLATRELLTNPALRKKVDRERARLVDLLAERVAVFNTEAARRGIRYPRYEGGFFVSVFTPDGEKTAKAMRERGVFVVPLPGAVRIALCSTPAADIPRLVETLEAGIAAAADSGGAQGPGGTGATGGRR